MPFIEGPKGLFRHGKPKKAVVGPMQIFSSSETSSNSMLNLYYPQIFYCDSAKLLRPSNSAMPLQFDSYQFLPSSLLVWRTITALSELRGTSPPSAHDNFGSTLCIAMTACVQTQAGKAHDQKKHTSRTRQRQGNVHVRLAL